MREIKSDPDLRHIPVVVLTTSRVMGDIRAAYDLGANSFATKPDTFAGLVQLASVVSHYWFDTVELPRL